MLKIMLLVGLFRVLVRGEVRIPRWGRMDSALMIFILLGTIMYLVRIGTFEAVVNRLGRIYEILGLYLLCRILLQDWGDLRAVIRCLMWLSLPVALFFMSHSANQHPIHRPYTVHLPSITAATPSASSLRTWASSERSAQPYNLGSTSL